MDESTFLELPLDRDLYEPKIFKPNKKKPLRILITEAASKIAYQLIYKICRGDVFGHDQEIILHLVNARGSIPHRSIFKELEECGFHVIADSVVTSDPKKAYKKINLVIFIALFEKLSGRSNNKAFLYQMMKMRQVVKNMLTYSEPDSKLVICSPSTKGVVILLTCLAKFEPDLNYSDVSGVTNLDEMIAKASLAAQLKTTTENIKNVVIWGATHPDTKNTTVYMYPPGDNGKYEKKHIPIAEALQDDHFLCGKFTQDIFRRTISPSLMKHGKAVAAATAKHIKYLYQGSDIQDEIISMATVVPSTRPYGMDEGIGFSFPVTSKHGVLKIREGISIEPYTHMMNLKVSYKLRHDAGVHCLNKVVNYVNRFEAATGKEFQWTEHELLADQNYKGWIWDYIITAAPNEFVPLVTKSTTNLRKSITWNEAKIIEKNTKTTKSSLRFNLNA